MKGTITLGVEVSSVQRLTALRESLHDHIPKEEFIASSSAVEDHPFTLWGAFRGKPDATWGPEVIMAQTEPEAAAKALAADSKRTVVTCLPGRVSVS